MENFNCAITAMLDDDGMIEALYYDLLTSDQKQRFDKIKAIYLEECLKDCNF